MFENNLDCLIDLMNRRLQSISKGELTAFDLLDLSFSGDQDMQNKRRKPARELRLRREVADLKLLTVIENDAQHILDRELWQSDQDLEQIERSKYLLFHVAMARVLGGNGEEYHLEMRGIVEKYSQLITHWRKKYADVGLKVVQGRRRGARKGGQIQKRVGKETRARVLASYNKLGSLKPRHRAARIAEEFGLNQDHVRRIIKNAKTSGMI